MSDIVSDPNRGGSFYHHLNNGNGKSGAIGIESGLTPRVVIRAAGNGILMVAADGVTPILTVPETGGVGVPTLAADPTTGDAKLYILAGVLKFWDGSNANAVVLAG